MLQLIGFLGFSIGFVLGEPFFRVSVIPRCSDRNLPDSLKVHLYERDTFTADDNLDVVENCHEGCILKTDDYSDLSPNLEFALKFVGNCSGVPFVRCAGFADVPSDPKVHHDIVAKATFSPDGDNDWYASDFFPLGGPIECPNNIRRRHYVHK